MGLLFLCINVLYQQPLHYDTPASVLFHFLACSVYLDWLSLQTKEYLKDPSKFAVAAAPAAASASSAPAAKKEEKKPEPESESDDDMGFGLFD